MGDDDKEKKRPNANYKLSNENINETEIVYHYNRERRLEKAPQAVRDLYREQPRRRFGFLHALVGNKPGAMLFGTIVFLCVFMLLLSFFGFTDDSRELDGNILSVKGKNYEGTVIIEVRKKPRKDKFARNIKPYTGPVNIAVFPPAKTGQEQSPQAANIFYQKIFFTNESEENYRFSVPFAQSELAIIFQTEKKTLNMTIKPDNK
jgi:hypothetical protein